MGMGEGQGRAGQGGGDLSQKATALANPPRFRECLPFAGAAGGFLLLRFCRRPPAALQASQLLLLRSLVLVLVLTTTYPVSPNGTNPWVLTCIHRNVQPCLRAEAGVDAISPQLEAIASC